ncbi:unnamed protein product, partial [Ectocarpus sp. 8 AP-2014]
MHSFSRTEKPNKSLSFPFLTGRRSKLADPAKCGANAHGARPLPLLALPVCGQISQHVASGSGLWAPRSEVR